MPLINSLRCLPNRKGLDCHVLAHSRMQGGSTYFNYRPSVYPSVRRELTHVHREIRPARHPRPRQVTTLFTVVVVVTHRILRRGKCSLRSRPSLATSPQVGSLLGGDEMHHAGRRISQLARKQEVCQAAMKRTMQGEESLRTRIEHGMSVDKVS